MKIAVVQGGNVNKVDAKMGSMLTFSHNCNRLLKGILQAWNVGILGNRLIYLSCREEWEKFRDILCDICRRRRGNEYSAFECVRH